MGLNTPIFQTLGCSTPIVYKPCQFALNKPQLGMLETYWITFPNIKLNHYHVQTCRLKQDSVKHEYNTRNTHITKK